MEKSTNIELITLDRKGAIVLDNGMMKIPATLSRVGVFNYLSADGSTRKELRTEAEVFDKESMASFELVPFVNEHPYKEGGAVTVENVKRLAVGTVGNVHRNGMNLDGTVLISDSETIRQVQEGKVAISCGYFNQREEKAGVWSDANGAQHQYTHVQHRIRGNHVALVQVGRAGPEARLRLDSADAAVLITDEQAETNKETKIMKTLTLDSIPCEMSEASAAIVTKVIGDRDAKIVAQTATLSERDAALVQAGKDKDKLQASLDSALADLKAATDPTAQAVKVAARVSLETSARKVLGDVDLSKMDTRGVKVAVVGKLKPSLSCDGKSDDYVAALYDDAMSAANAGNVASQVIAAQVEAAKKNGQPEVKVTADSADVNLAAKLIAEAGTSKPWAPNAK